jgi:hypothetical protein
VVSMREVESSNTHTSIDKSLELINLPTSRSKSTYDLVDGKIHQKKC